MTQTLADDVEISELELVIQAASAIMLVLKGGLCLVDGSDEVRHFRCSGLDRSH